MKRAFGMKQKAFFFIFNGLSWNQIKKKKNFEGQSPTLNEVYYKNKCKNQIRFLPILRLTEKYFTLNAFGYNKLLDKISEFVDKCHNQNLLL